MKVPFVKMHGIGNDYVYLDAVADPSLAERADLPQLARWVSNRHAAVGSDGLILVCSPTSAGTAAGAHVRMRMFNADGSESEMCGNGVRCVAKFAHDRLGIRAQPLQVETGRGVLSIDYRVLQGRMTTATVDMGEPRLAAEQIPVQLPQPAPGGQVVDFPADKYLAFNPRAAWLPECGLDLRMTCVSMGNPHAVFFCTHADAVPLDTFGPFIERRPIFPSRINVHVVQVVDRVHAVMRTWERGSGITMACGTGACAVLVAGVLTGRLDRTASVRLPGGNLSIRWDAATDHVFMTGPADDAFEGTFTWPREPGDVS